MTIKKTIYVNSAGLLTDSITNTLGFSLTGNGITFKRGDTVTLTVIFLDASGTPVALPDGNLITMAVKPLGQYETSILYAQAQVTVAGQVAAAGYDFNFTLNEATLHDALRLNEPFAPTIESVAGMLELTWSNDGTIYRSSQNSALFTITNDVIRGNETLTMALTETPETFISDRAVRYDQEQSLTVAEQQRARDNIGVDGTVEVAKSIHTTVRAEVAIQKGQAVYISGAAGSNKKVRLAKADTEATSSKTIGLSSEDLVVNGSGDIVTEGSLSGLSIDVSALTVAEGDPVWLSPTTAGGLLFGAANKPVAPNHMVFLGIVTRITGNTLTDIFVKVQNGFELQELHNVQITSPATGEALVYDDVAGVWKNQPVSSELQELQDVQISSVQDGEVLVYDATAGLWKNESISSAVTLSSSTSTGMSGFIFGNGVVLNAKAGAELPTASTVALRDDGGRLSASMLRVHQSTTSKYVQFNPPSSDLTDHVSLQLPHQDGTIATNNTAVMVSGNQLSIAGSKTFSGQIELTGQSVFNETSALTRGLGDGRYALFSKAFPAASLSSTTTTLVDIASLSLGIGVYHIKAYAQAYNVTGSAANATIRLAGMVTDPATACNFRGFYSFGGSTISGDTTSTPKIFILSGAQSIVATSSTGSLPRYYVMFDCTVEVKNASEIIKLQFRQTTTNAVSVTCPNDAYLFATKLN